MNGVATGNEPGCYETRPRRRYSRRRVQCISGHQRCSHSRCCSGAASRSITAANAVACHRLCTCGTCSNGMRYAPHLPFPFGVPLYYTSLLATYSLSRTPCNVVCSGRRREFRPCCSGFIIRRKYKPERAPSFLQRCLVKRLSMGAVPLGVRPDV